MLDFQTSVPLKTKMFIDYNYKIQIKNAKAYLSFMCFSSVKRFKSLVFT